MTGASLTSRIVRILRVAAAPRWAAPAIVGLGVAGAAMEGAGLYLFIPLVQSLGGSGAGGGVVSRIMDRALAPIDPDWRTAVIIAALCATVAVKAMVALVAGYVTQYAEGLVSHRLRLRVFAQTLSGGADRRPDHRRSDLVNTLTGNTYSVGKALNLSYRVLVCLCTCTVFLLLLLVISPPLTALALALLGVTALLVHRATRRAETVGRTVVEENNLFGQRMWENLSALQLIRSFGREAYEVARFGDRSEAVRRRLLQLSFLWSLPGPLAEVCGAVAIGVLILAGTAVGTGLPELAAFLAVLYRLQGPTRELMQSRVAIDSLVAPVEDVAGYLAATAEPHVRDGTAPAPPLREAIVLEDVSFRYAEGEPLALDGVSLSIPAGKTTAIVGRSGAGKSTLFGLILRFHDPSSGVVRADGAALPTLRLAAWRSRLALMSQDAYCFNDTVEANIGYGDPDATPAEIRRAAEIAGADAFIHTLPGGYSTLLGDQGVRLSGGQRQRIALARAILRQASILLLDEPTNALDNETERAFQAALAEYSQGRTVVVIAHRLSTVRAADQVIVLEEGRVVEQGPPGDLLARPGRFARMHGLEAAEPARRAAG